MIHIDDSPTATLYTESELRIFTDKAITPFFFFEDIVSDETHRSIHDNSVGTIPDNHALFIKEIELITHDFLKHSSSLCFIRLRTLYSGDACITKESDSFFEPVRFDTVIRIEESYDICVGICETESLVERSGLVTI